MRASLTVGLAALASPAFGWGMFGHQITATIAQVYLLPSTREAICGILPGTYKCNLAGVASWPDEIKQGASFKSYSNLHFVNAKGDDPPNKCVFGELGWLAEGNILKGIVDGSRNVTTTSGSKINRDRSLRFLVHFLGDIHQPFHLTGQYFGANNVKVWWQKRETIRQVWEFFNYRGNGGIEVVGELGKGEAEGIVPIEDDFWRVHFGITQRDSSKIIVEGDEGAAQVLQAAQPVFVWWRFQSVSVGCGPLVASMAHAFLGGYGRGGHFPHSTYSQDLHAVWDDSFIDHQVLFVNSSEYTSVLPTSPSTHISSSELSRNQRIEAALKGLNYDPYIRFILLEGVYRLWAADAKEWIMCPQASTTKFGGHQAVFDKNSGTFSVPSDLPTVCPLHWATQIHPLLCTPIWPEGLTNQTERRELSEDYATSIRDALIIEKQLAMGGIRLASVLNGLFGSDEDKAAYGIVPLFE